MMHNNWFERGIMIYGMCSDVMATGDTLLRVVDPNNESGTLEDTGTACTIMSLNPRMTCRPLYSIPAQSR